MVELALMLPVLALLMVMAIDVGRLYFGWIAETNIARAGASYAGLHPDAWNLPYSSSTPTNQAVQDTYRLRMQLDAQAINCVLPSPLPAPMFVDASGNGTANQVNDLVKVHLTCGFRLLTPFAASLHGQSAGHRRRSGLPDSRRRGRRAPDHTRSLTIAVAHPQPSATPTPAPSPSPCVVPQFIGDPKNQSNLKNKWQAAGFVRNNLSVTGGNWNNVGSQSLIGGSHQPCDISIVVGP